MRHMIMTSSAQCYECGRVFNILIDEEADEWFNGHDCEGE
jgi:hypothetical protein